MLKYKSYSERWGGGDFLQVVSVLQWFPIDEKFRLQNRMSEINHDGKTQAWCEVVALIMDFITSLHMQYINICSTYIKGNLFNLNKT